MLVLTRGRNDQVVFPSLGIKVEILRIAGNKVRIGIEAPPEVPVVRNEILDSREPDAAAEQPERLTHEARNRLHRATLGLRFLQRSLAAGQAADAEAAIFKILNELKALEAEFGSPDARGAQGARNVGPKALLVEDDRNESELLAGYLRLSGFDVDTAEDGLQAMVRLADRDRPDVVLLDMRMPRFDGPRTISAIRRHPDYQGLRIFAVSGSDPRQTDVVVGPQGVDRWFRKPVDPAELVQAIRHDLAEEAVLA